jgi:small ligand-binding sensory domain FIST
MHTFLLLAIPHNPKTGFRDFALYQHPALEEPLEVLLGGNSANGNHVHQVFLPSELLSHRRGFIFSRSCAWVKRVSQVGQLCKTIGETDLILVQIPGRDADHAITQMHGDRLHDTIADDPEEIPIRIKCGPVGDVEHLSDTSQFANQGT